MIRYRVNKKKIYYSILLLIVLVSPSLLRAQVESPNRKYLFREDSENYKKVLKRYQKTILSTDKPASQDLDFKAPTVEYLEKEKKMKGSGGVLVSKGDIQAQADEALVDLKTNDVELKGDVVITQPRSTLKASSAKFNLDSERGSFSDTEFTIEEGNYHIRAKEAQKLSDTRYKLFDCGLTTCDCADGSLPWIITSSEADITQEGYAHTYNTALKFHGVPAFFSPYLGFPVKTERSTGLLAPTFGYGSRDGFQLKQPFFLVINDSADFMLSPFIETRTRRGSGFDLRAAFSRRHNFEGRIIYSDESPRNGDLRGTNVAGLSDPTFDENRFGGFLKHSFRTANDSFIPFSMITDLHLVSDDLFLREIEDEDIGLYNARYTTSKILMRMPFSPLFSVDVEGEYNQSILTDDDFVLQRLPEVSINSFKSFRPFGFNPYGLKVKARNKVLITDFVRDKGFDGLRYDVNPSVAVPFHFKNYLNNVIALNYHYTAYDQRDVSAIGGGSDLEKSNSRSVVIASYRASTGLERVYSVDENNWFTHLTRMGRRDSPYILKRIKHTIEPSFTYRFIPDTTQDDLPLYDSLDRIRERSLFSFGLTTRLFGRFDPISGSADTIPELTPRVTDLPIIEAGKPLAVPGEVESFGELTGNIPIRKGPIRQLAYLSLRQSYDYKEDVENNDPRRNSWSDLAFDAGFFPVANFGMSFLSNIDLEDRQFSSWSLATHVRRDRGDALIGRYTFIDNRVSQLEGNLVVVLNDRLKFGAYTRYDDIDGEFIENRLALRLSSACNCWHFDVGYSDRINPDRKRVEFRLTLAGLGDITQGIGMEDFQR
ncbi:MAG: LPS-assembly protein LptD [Candidatus Dadabacteria bacterium]|nr:MAG: LPS-assembly protein LptD [Candidatus Dadabacteria bacterium]